MNTERASGRIDSATRVIAASPERIFAAFEDPGTLMQWLPPNGMTGRAHEYEFREGGRYRIELEYRGGDHGPGKSTANSDISRGEFVRIVPGRLVRQTVRFESDDDAFPDAMVMTWAFDRAPWGTSVTITATNVPPGISAEDHRKGLASSLENLSEFVGG